PWDVLEVGVERGLIESLDLRGRARRVRGEGVASGGIDDEARLDPLDDAVGRRRLDANRTRRRYAVLLVDDAMDGPAIANGRAERPGVIEEHRVEGVTRNLVRVLDGLPRAVELEALLLAVDVVVKARPVLRDERRVHLGQDADLFEDRHRLWKKRL